VPRRAAVPPVESQEDLQEALIAGTFILVALLVFVTAAFVLVLRPGAGRSGASAAGAQAGTPSAVAVTATEFKLTPNPLQMASPGDLTITFRNSGVIEHDFTIDGVQGKADAQPGQMATSVFKITKAGTYTYYCSVPGHREAGMVGTLVVAG